MDYNSQREKLILPEYGRNIQNMIDLAKRLKDKEEKEACVYTIFNAMCNVNTVDKNLPDYEEKIWNQLAFLANYELDINYPCKIERKEDNNKNVEILKYPQKKILFRHYGANIEAVLKKISEMDPSEERDQLTVLVAQQMAKSLAEWNKDALREEKIAQDIDYYTKGHVQLDPDLFKMPIINIPQQQTSSNNSNKKWRKNK